MDTKELKKEFDIKETFYSKYTKRFFDFTISLLAIIILSPVLLITYLLTIIFLGAPAIYKQARPGRNFKIFYIYKFRSMTNKRDENGNLLPDALRITKFGKFLRKTSLDELPQLFNILKGDLSIIGPRPRLVKDMIFYNKQAYAGYVIKPGLTGITQVSGGRDGLTWEEIFKLDLEYAKKITFWGDVKLFFKTFIAIFKTPGESHSNSEEDKKPMRDYYYSDYLLRTGKITEQQYKYGKTMARIAIANKKYINYFQIFHNTEAFENLLQERKQNKKI